MHIRVYQYSEYVLLADQYPPIMESEKVSIMTRCSLSPCCQMSWYNRVAQTRTSKGNGGITEHPSLREVTNYT